MRTYPDPIPAIKRVLAEAMLRALKPWTPTEICFYIPLDRARWSDLRRGRLKRFSAERLIRWLDVLGYRVDVTITQVPKRDRRPGVP
jgi:hypothetical protein